MLQVCTLDFQGLWAKYLSLVEFSYNNSFQSTVGMAPYEVLFGQKCQSPVDCNELGERKYLGPESVEQATEAIKKIKERMKTFQSRQKSYADQRH